MADTPTKFESELAKFDPQVAELRTIAEQAASLTITDFSDKAQIKVVHDKRMELKNIRVSITKKGKELREEANAFTKAVLTKEKEMVGVIQPEEERLEKLEEEAERIAEIEKRKASLPERKFKLSSLSDGIEISDEGILEMDDNAFDSYFNQRVANWNLAEKERLEAERKADEERKAKEAEEEAKRKEAEAEAKRKADEAEAAKRAAEQKKLDDERAKLEEDKRKHEEEKRLEAAKKEAAEKARKEAEAEAKRKEEERLKREAEEKAAEEKRKEEAAKAEAERKAKEKAELEAKAKYQAFLKEHGWTAETQGDFYLQESDTQVVLYKKLGVYKK